MLCTLLLMYYAAKISESQKVSMWLILGGRVTNDPVELSLVTIWWFGVRIAAGKKKNQSIGFQGSCIYNYSSLFWLRSVDILGSGLTWFWWGWGWSMLLVCPTPVCVYTHAQEWSYTHIKDQVVRVRVWWITETQKDPVCTLTDRGINVLLYSKCK